jgi:hypothetical protein
VSPPFPRPDRVATVQSINALFTMSYSRACSAGDRHDGTCETDIRGQDAQSSKNPNSKEPCSKEPSANHPAITFQTKGKWWSQTGSNRRPHACKARALPTELWPHHRMPQAKSSRSFGHEAQARNHVLMVVGLGRLERPTSPLSGVRSNHLSYRPETGTQPHARHNLATATTWASSLSAKKEKRRRRCPANARS